MMKKVCKSLHAGMCKFGKKGGKTFANTPLWAMNTAGELFTKPLKEGGADYLFMGGLMGKKLKKQKVK